MGKITDIYIDGSDKVPEFTVYSEGLCFASVCSCLPENEILNRMTPTGIKSQWMISKEKFRTGESNPCPCNEYPETHKHYLLSC